MMLVSLESGLIVGQLWTSKEFRFFIVRGYGDLDCWSLVILLVIHGLQRIELCCNSFMILLSIIVGISLYCLVGIDMVDMDF